MSAERKGRGASGRALEELLEACGHPVTDDGGHLLPGGLLLLVLRARERGLGPEHPGWTELSAASDLTPAALAAVQRFADGLLANAPEAAKVTFCLGVSCSLNGASAIRGLILESLERHGRPVGSDEVYCLSQCDRGPTMMLGRQVYCGTDNAVVEDRRDWRGDAGPVSISNSTRPVLD